MSAIVFSLPSPTSLLPVPAFLWFFFIKVTLYFFPTWSPPQTKFRLTTCNHLKALPSISIAWCKTSSHCQQRLLSCHAHSHHHVLKPQQICQISYLQLISYTYYTYKTLGNIKIVIPFPLLFQDFLNSTLFLFSLDQHNPDNHIPTTSVHSCLWKPLDWFYFLELFLT